MEKQYTADEKTALQSEVSLRIGQDVVNQLIPEIRKKIISLLKNKVIPAELRQVEIIISVTPPASEPPKWPETNPNVFSVRFSGD